MKGPHIARRLSYFLEAKSWEYSLRHVASAYHVAGISKLQRFAKQ
jgi:hypothetical protein